NKLGLALPTAQVVAALHAGVRWAKTRRFRGSDFADFHHAAAALPYCDVFLTERYLCHAVSTRPAALAARFDTRVATDPSEAVEAVKTVLARTRVSREADPRQPS